MSTNYSPSGTYPTFPLTLPADGELINQAVLCVAILEPLIDAVGLNCTRTFTAAQTFGVSPGYTPGAVTDTATFTIDTSKPHWVGPVLSQDCVVTARSSTAPIPTTGQEITITADLSASGFNYLVYREGGAILIVSLITSAGDKAWADLWYTGAAWRLKRYGGGAVPGIGS